MTAFPGVDLNRRCAGGANARGIVHRLLVAFDNGAGYAVFQSHQGFGEQGGFTGAGAGNQIQHQQLAGGKARAVAGGNLVVFIQHVDFDFQHPALAHARRVGARFAVAIVQVAVVRGLRFKLSGSDAGNGQRRTACRGERRAAEQRVRVTFIALYIEVAIGTTTGGTHTLLLINFNSLNL